MTVIIRGSEVEGFARPSTGSGSHIEGNASTASGVHSHAEGTQTAATAAQAHAEGNLTTASGPYSHAQGVGTTASAQASHAEGSGSTASGDYSSASGSYSVASRVNQRSHGGSFINSLTAQTDEYVFGGYSTNATPILLTMNDTTTATLTGTGTNVLTVPVRMMFLFRIEACARRTDTQGDMAGFTITGVIGRDSSGNARIIGTPTTVSWADSGAATWTLAVSVNTGNATNNYLALTATGEAAKTIVWVAGLYATNSITYA